MKHILKTILFLGLLTTLQAEVFNHYKEKKNYTIESKEAINLKFNFKSKKQNCRLYFLVTDEDNNLLFRDDYYMKDKKDSFNLPIKKGVYDIELSATIGCDNKYFEFEIIQEKGNFEKEFNNDFETATILNQNEVLKGYLQNKDNTRKYDVNVYKINVEQKGILNLDLSHKKINKKEYFYLELFDEDEKQLLKANSYINTRGIKRNVGVDRGVYFIKVSTYTNSTKVRNSAYNVSYDFIPSENIEIEFNDDEESATAILENVFITGYYQDKNVGKNADKDFYVFNAKAGDYDLLFEHKSYKNNPALIIKVYDEDMKLVKSFSAKSKLKKEVFKLGLKEGKYFIEFKNVYHSLGGEY